MTLVESLYENPFVNRTETLQMQVNFDRYYYIENYSILQYFLYYTPLRQTDYHHRWHLHFHFGFQKPTWRFHSYNSNHTLHPVLQTYLPGNLNSTPVQFPLYYLHRCHIAYSRMDLMCLHLKNQIASNWNNFHQFVYK